MKIKYKCVYYFLNIFKFLDLIFLSFRTERSEVNKLLQHSEFNIQYSIFDIRYSKCIYSFLFFIFNLIPGVTPFRRGEPNGAGSQLDQK